MKKILWADLKIKNNIYKGNVFLAPMAGVTDFSFRVLCKEFGASLCFTEMINSKALCYNDHKTRQMMQINPNEGDVSIQIFGAEPYYMAKAAEIITNEFNFKHIDINMGCPAPKIVKNNEGSALMKDPKLACEIVKEVKKNTNLPVTVKIRKGWDSNNINYLDFAKALQETGIDAITIHGRTTKQYYSGKADWDVIKDLKENLSIPVIGNGDIFSAKDAREMMEYTGCDGILVARGSNGNPFIFKEIYNELNCKEDDFLITDLDKINYAIKQLDLYLSKESNKTNMEIRKHLNWYLKGLKNSCSLKNQINNTKDFYEVKKMLNEYAQTLT